MTLRRSTRAALGILALSASGSLLGCDPGYRVIIDDPIDETPPDPGTVACADMPACDPDIHVDPEGSALVITDPEVLAKVPLQRVIDQINQQSGLSTDAKTTMQRLFDTMNDTAGAKFTSTFHCDDPSNPAFQLKTEDTFTCPRAEGALASSEGFFTEGDPDHFFPVAIVHRFDLLPLDGSRCGQYRIVYAKESGLTDPNNRVFLIFEAALLNPAPGCIQSCYPVAALLKGLEGKPAAEVAAQIDTLFFTGIGDFMPVVHPMHYGLGTEDTGYGGLEGGQVRVSMHMEDPWDMRELRLGLSPQADDVVFVPATVKNSPAAASFDPLSASYGAELVRSQLLPLSLPALASTELTGIQMFTPIEVNGVESVLAGEKKSDYLAAATAGGDTSLTGSIDTMLSDGGFGADCPPEDPLNAEAILRRATALSCAGCHAPAEMLGPTRSIGCGLTWPDSIGQAHVTEQGELSPALREVFLPHRAKVLETYLQACDIDAIYGNLQTGAPDGSFEKRMLPARRTLGGSTTH